MDFHTQPLSTPSRPEPSGSRRPGPATIDAVVRDWAEQEPLRHMLSFDGRAMSAQTLAALAGRAAACLEGWGIGAADRVALWAQNSEAWVIWFLAASWRGASVVALHPGLEPEELAQSLRQARPGWLIADETARGRNLRDIAENVVGAAGGVVPASNAFGLRGMCFMSGGDGSPALDGLLAASAAKPVPRPHGNGEATACLLFTSGSSGRPKLVQLSHRALLTNAVRTAEAAGIGADDRIASPLPLYHAGGLSSGLVLSLATGARWCSQARFQAEPLLRTIAQQRCTVVQGVPTMFKALNEKARAFDTSTLRLGFVGGAHAPASLCSATVQALGLARMCVTYGQSEFGPTIALTTGREPAGAGDDHVGTLIDGATLRIVDPATGALQAEGCAGEIQVQGPTLMQGYFEDAAATCAAIAEDGWLRTGDLGVLRQGCLRVLGRLKSLIIRGGENIAPGEVEEALLQIPGVVDACVVPVFSEHWGETVCAVVQTDSAACFDVGAMRAQADALLARYKRPEHVLVWSALPLLSSGKVDRRLVKERAAAELALPPLP